jgi:hypothetical protein
MLITLAAKKAVGGLGAASLASVQAKAWTDITGADGTVVGEEICFLSAGKVQAPPPASHQVRGQNLLQSHSLLPAPAPLSNEPAVVQN